MFGDKNGVERIMGVWSANGVKGVKGVKRM